MKDGLKIVGTARCWYTDENGNKIHYTEKKNAIVNAGFDFVRHAIADANARPNIMKYVAIGQGSSATAVTMTTLEDEGNRVAGTWSFDDDNKSFTITAVFARNTITKKIQEVGVFNAESAGTMLDRAVYAEPIPALPNLEFTQTLTFELA